jgi:hypothetical protein
MAEFQLKREMMAAEAQLKREAMAFQTEMGRVISGVQFGGEVG